MNRRSATTSDGWISHTRACRLAGEGVSLNGMSDESGDTIGGTIRTMRNSATLALLLALQASGCAFVENAATVVFGDDNLPSVEQNALMTVDEVNEALNNTSVEGGIALNVSRDATWADLRNTLCNAATYADIDGPKLVFDRSSGQPNIPRLDLIVEVDNPSGDIPCTLGGIHISVIVEFLPFTADQATSVRDQLNNDVSALEESILQMRFRFDALGLMVGDADDETVRNSRNELLEHFHVELTDPSIAQNDATPFDDQRYNLVPFFLLNTIGPGSPQRFDLHEDHPVTRSLKDAVLSPNNQVLTLSLDTRLAADQLERLPIDQSGLAVDFQFEVVISVLDSLI
jgi:hypothetical protein